MIDGSFVGTKDRILVDIPSISWGFMGLWPGEELNWHATSSEALRTRLADVLRATEAEKRRGTEALTEEVRRKQTLQDEAKLVVWSVFFFPCLLGICLGIIIPIASSFSEGLKPPTSKRGGEEWRFRS